MKRSSFPTDAPRAASSLRLTQLVRATILAGLTMAVLPSAHADVTIDFNGLPPVGQTQAHVHLVLELYWALLQRSLPAQAQHLRIHCPSP